MRRLPTVGVGLALMVLAVGTAAASHSWGGYHWARSSNPFTLQLGDNVSGSWDGMLQTASSDWSKSNVLDTTVVAGGTNPKPCKATSGRVEVCSTSYGNTGWLGLAQIWVSGEHITQGIVKNNDYYFGDSSYQYNNTAEMQHVICQEIGHTLGLDHQDESGASLNTCMDYYHNTSDTDTQSTHPNQHDYDELDTIYSHTDGGGGGGGDNCPPRNPHCSGGGIGNAPPFSQASRANGSLYVDHLAGGVTRITHVLWTL